MENKVDVLVHIRKNDTGEIRIYRDWLYLDEDGLPDVFIWEDGNYSCDCNRHLFFSRAHAYNENIKWEPEPDCGNTEYSVNIILGDKCIYSEFENLSNNMRFELNIGMNQ